MRSQAPALMPIFRSHHQAALLAWLFLHPDREYTLTDLAQRFDVPLTTLHREAERLVLAGIVRDRYLGRARLLQAKTSNRGGGAADPAAGGHLRPRDGDRRGVQHRQR